MAGKKNIYCTLLFIFEFYCFLLITSQVYNLKSTLTIHNTNKSWRKYDISINKLQGGVLLLDLNRDTYVS